jgi:hypothetical protein|tara:strand:+ start:159 stop:383 length:225 start_codon:yes stop_codon:yes gene_type:complete
VNIAVVCLKTIKDLEALYKTRTSIKGEEELAHLNVNDNFATQTSINSKQIIAVESASFGRGNLGPSKKQLVRNC